MVLDAIKLQSINQQVHAFLQHETVSKFMNLGSRISKIMAEVLKDHNIKSVEESIRSRNIFYAQAICFQKASEVALRHFQG